MEIPYQIHVHHDKRLKDYLFDFFMLFFAVTLGFFVENTREHLSRNKKEKEYMRSMIQDLKEDTAKTTAYINYNSGLLSGLDSLIKIIYLYRKGDTLVTKNLYLWYTAYARSTYAVHFTDRTITQLKSSGFFSTLSAAVSDSILKYEEATEAARAQENSYKDGLAKALDFSGNIFDYRYIRYNVNFSSKDYYKYQTQTNYKLLTEDAFTLTKYANMLELWKQVIVVYIWNLQSVKVRAQFLIPFLQKEYNIT
ncbi:MAG TPA: hypothetical protein VK498_13335 [Ferruginibacter sp.]|nr:hypothetical protein [Ferruginibacter sp.]